MGDLDDSLSQWIQERCEHPTDVMGMVQTGFRFLGSLPPLPIDAQAAKRPKWEPLSLEELQAQRTQMR